MRECTVIGFSLYGHTPTGLCPWSPSTEMEARVYRSTFPKRHHIEEYLRCGRMIDQEETAADMVNRVVAALAEPESRFGADPAAFADLLGAEMDSARIVFSTPIMTNAGRHHGRPLAACAVPPVDLRGDLAKVRATVDSYHQAGMGTGFNLTEVEDPVAVLRHLNDIAVDGAASGREDRPVGNMAILNLSHPRAAEFIECKRGADGRGEQWKFNISLAVTDTDMRRAASGRGREADLLTAAAEAAWDCADPGLLFLDRMNEDNPTPEVGQYVSTAPCAEVGLVAGETCQFGYVNLGAFHRPGGRVPLDLDGLADTVTVLVRALDNAIEASMAHYPHPLSGQVMAAKRKIGVGICGLADLLLAARIPYDSVQGRHLAQEALAFVNYVSKLASVELAEERGACSAVRLGTSRYADTGFLKRFANLDVAAVSPDAWGGLAERIATSGALRNSSTIALPPTGRSAPVIEASTGIEPLFQLTHQTGVHPDVAATLVDYGRVDLIDHVLSVGRVPTRDDVPAELAAVLATATQIKPAGHLGMAAAAQACVDEAVSKTVNLDPGATAADVADTYLSAWDMGLKGITVYRDGSRTAQPKAL